MDNAVNDGSNSPPKVVISAKDQLFSILLGEFDTVIERTESLAQKIKDASDSYNSLLKQEDDTNKLLVSNIKALSAKVEEYRKTLADANQVTELNSQQILESHKALARKVTMLSIVNYVLFFSIIAILYVGLHQ